MLEIAILTFHTACNYGAFLQAYALQEMLNSFENVNAYIFDYKCDIVENKYKPSAYLRNKGKPVKKAAQLILCYQTLKKRNKVFSEFREKMYHYKNRNVLKNQVKEFSQQYDAFIVGSDQVWNRDIIENDETFFLNFVEKPVKKYSYAASIGKSELSENEINELAERICSFSKIAIREHDVIPQIRKIMEVPNISCTVDPVFLLDTDQWKKLSQFKQRSKYILFFMMGMSSSALPAMGFAKRLAKKYGCEVVYLSDQERWYKFRELNHFGVATPTEFIGLIEHAEFVVTNSFHATAFSILLHTPFFVETSILRSGRITSLLESAGLEQCALNKGKCERPEVPINWSEVDDRLRPLINSSKEYLFDIIADLENLKC